MFCNSLYQCVLEIWYQNSKRVRIEIILMKLVLKCSIRILNAFRLRCRRVTVWKNEKFTLTEKNFVKSTYLVNPLLSRNVCKNSNFRNIHTLLYSLTLTLFWQKFRESNMVTKEITKLLIWRNIFLILPHCGTLRYTVEIQKFTLTEKGFVKSTTYLVISLAKTLLSRNFMPKHNFHMVCGW